jgi:periplasmic protein TonB
MIRGALAVRQRPSMQTSVDPNRAPERRVARRRTLPATGLPVRRDDRRGWGVVSALLHLLAVALLITPVATHEGLVTERPQGAGGPGPAGGGGGGKRGTGGVQERVRYVRVAPPPAPVPVPQIAVVPPPVVKAQPIVTPPVKPLTPEAKPEAKNEMTKIAEVTAPVAGVGGGTGRDGSAGSGPGSGGGVGSGVGTGRGSGTGPGTGGGSQADYPPSPTELFIPPLPMPDKVRGFHLVAEYDVDSTGKVLDFKFTPTRDGSYNRRLDEVLRSFKFRPGTRPDGTPIRMKAQIIYDF